MKVDVAIIGAGPGGSSCGAFLRKYNTEIEVAIFEREIFPRDHVGESQLPLLSNILHELGVWDKVEAADFPVKIGATYRWGNSDDLWDFHFLPGGKFVDEPRPAKFEGQRQRTAFQVDRAKYDKILADHAEALGCRVHYGCGVKEVLHTGDRVDGLVLETGEVVEARRYVDASGNAAIIRRRLGVQVEEPSALKNVAFWDYWQNAEWAVSIGVGGTRVQVLSLGYGWIWFIPLSPERTSIGLVCPAEYYKKSGLSPEEIYLKAVSEEPRVCRLTNNAHREGNFAATKDWSFVAERMAGENWMLVGETLGFADPILAAGLTITQASAREAAFIMLEEFRGTEDSSWLREQYQDRNERRVRQHIRFADYWYSANAHFTDLKEFTREIAKDVGLELDGEKAFQWLGTGGFIEEDMQVGGFATVSLFGVHKLGERLSETPAASAIDGMNMFRLLLEGAVEVSGAQFAAGRVQRISVLKRNGKVLPVSNLFGLIVRSLKDSPRLDSLLEYVVGKVTRLGFSADHAKSNIYECLEAMVRDGWAEATYSPEVPTAFGGVPAESEIIQANRDGMST